MDGQRRYADVAHRMAALLACAAAALTAGAQPDGQTPPPPQLEALRATVSATRALNDPKAYMQGKRWIEQGLSPDPARLGDGGQDLKALI